VLGLFGGADPHNPVEEVDRFRQALEEAGVPNEIVVYEGAPHSFFDRSQDEHREACEDASPVHRLRTSGGLRRQP
jgi:carboxymethylenebutenolidase